MILNLIRKCSSSSSVSIISASISLILILRRPWGETSSSLITFLKTLDSNQLEKAGIASKERAFNEFRPEKYIEEIVGDLWQKDIFIKQLI